MDPVKLVFTLVVAGMLFAFYMAVVPRGEVSYYSDAEVIGPVPQEPGVTTYAR